jgi:hypothetical protein
MRKEADFIYVHYECLVILLKVSAKPRTATIKAAISAEDQTPDLQSIKQEFVSHSGQKFCRFKPDSSSGKSDM